jgi:hypothetical protein
MPAKGYDIFERDDEFESFKYFEEHEDAAEQTLNIKNFVEGYWDSLHTIRKRVYLFKNHDEYNKEQELLSRQVVVH